VGEQVSILQPPDYYNQLSFYSPGIVKETKHFSRGAWCWLEVLVGLYEIRKPKFSILG